MFDANDIGAKAGIWLRKQPATQRAFVILIDDLEHDRRDCAQGVFDRYRAALDAKLCHEKSQASVQFFVPMLEAYYFTHPDVLTKVLGIELSSQTEDVESLRHPKNQLDIELKRSAQKFKEIEHGEEIINRLELERVLSNPKTCCSLRSLMAWCWAALGRSDTDDFQLRQGCRWPLTSSQIASLNSQP